MLHQFGVTGSEEMGQIEQSRYATSVGVTGVRRDGAGSNFLFLLEIRAMLVFGSRNPLFFEFSSIGKKQIRINRVKPSLGVEFSKCRFSFLQKATEFSLFTEKASKNNLKITRKAGKKQHHLWIKRDSAGSGQKALNLVRIVSALPNEKEAVYGALDKWTAWETEFPLIAATKALRILRKRSQWIRVIQMKCRGPLHHLRAMMTAACHGLGCFQAIRAALRRSQASLDDAKHLRPSLEDSRAYKKRTMKKLLMEAFLNLQEASRILFKNIYTNIYFILQVSKWMLSKGQGATMGTYDTLLLAFDMDQRVDEAESLWNMILHTHTRSISKQLFARMISLYDHHNIPDKIIEVFADMEELGVKPDEDTVRKVARAFQKLGQADKKKLVLKKYLSKWKYIHYNGERVRFFHLDASRVESNIKFGKQEVMMVTTDVVKVMVVIPLSLGSRGNSIQKIDYTTVVLAGIIVI
ncbi:hypothetical protein TEA_015642 [Camellia sinensis var. sinensis]|uniref:Pentacotripeptide-repeat region of PRORP domain-containing protein n=1 Tax=Camellia sinensis var. sinensis TaxID=542762 RepID=A0A4S4EEA8_CAMSN|nr:hypothetical protein TEA_015642 [Camellia sinensis var. sinensis]